MRVFIFSLLASLVATTSASALEIKGLWLDNKEWSGVQALVQIYDCEDGSGYCGRITRAAKGELQPGWANHLLIKSLRLQRNGNFKGIINPPVSFVNDSNVTIKKLDERTISYSSCFLPVCKGTMTKLQ